MVLPKSAVYPNIAIFPSSLKIFFNFFPSLLQSLKSNCCRFFLHFKRYKSLGYSNICKFFSFHSSFLLLFWINLSASYLYQYLMLSLFPLCFILRLEFLKSENGYNNKFCAWHKCGVSWSNLFVMFVYFIEHTYIESWFVYFIEQIYREMIFFHRAHIYTYIYVHIRIVFFIEQIYIERSDLFIL